MIDIYLCLSSCSFVRAALAFWRSGFGASLGDAYLVSIILFPDSVTKVSLVLRSSRLYLEDSLIFATALLTPLYLIFSISWLILEMSFMYPTVCSGLYFYLDCLDFTFNLSFSPEVSVWESPFLDFDFSTFFGDLSLFSPLSFLYCF